MGQVSAKLRRVEGGYSHWCPACESMHVFAVDQAQRNGARWAFDGNVNVPTFAPSMHIKWGKYADPSFVDEDNLSGVCHYILTAGVLNYCGDCTHAMRGQAVPLPDLPQGYRDQ